MLLKLASMFLTNIFYYPKVIFKIKKRDTTLLHFWIILYKLYDIYLKVDGSLGNTKLRHSTNKFVVSFKFLKYFSLLWYVNTKILFLLHLAGLSNFLTNSIASLGLSVVLINCSKPLLSIFSLLLIISESRSFSYTYSLLNLGCFLVSSKPKN